MKGPGNGKRSASGNVFGHRNSGSSGKGAKRARSSNNRGSEEKRSGPCPYCKVLSDQNEDIMIRFDHDGDECERVGQYSALMHMLHSAKAEDGDLKPAAV